MDASRVSLPPQAAATAEAPLSPEVMTRIFDDMRAAIKEEARDIENAIVTAPASEKRALAAGARPALLELAQRAEDQALKRAGASAEDAAESWQRYRVSTSHVGVRTAGMAYLSTLGLRVYVRV